MSHRSGSGTGQVKVGVVKELGQVKEVGIGDIISK